MLYGAPKDDVSPPWHRYDMAVLDPDDHPDLSGLPSDFVLMAYVSLGQSEPYRDYWPSAKDTPMITNVRVGGSSAPLIDARDPRWREILLDETIPAILAKGFNGLFLDTLDAAAYLESLDAKRFEGSKAAMVSLVRDIRQRYPDLYLISNNGYAVLESIAPCLNGLGAESIFGRLIHESGTFERVSPERTRTKIELLKKTAARYGLPVFNIEYADPEDRGWVGICVEESKKIGFRPYVAGSEFDRLYAQRD